MRHRIQNMTISFLLILICSTASLINCGGGGGGGSSPLQPPTYNASGTWNVTETSKNGNCPVPAPTDSYSLSVNHTAGSNNLVVTDLNTSMSYNGTISGNTVNYSGPSIDSDCPGSISIAVTITMSSETYLSGNANWTCNYTGGSCSGTTLFNATKVGGGADTMSPTAPTSLTSTLVSSNQINLSWTASQDNVGVAEYRLERCQGAACSTFGQIATPSTTSYNNIGLSASTSYSYRVRAVDAAGNFSGYSNTFSATTQAGGGGGDTTPPTEPTSLTSTLVSSSQINLSWTASADNVGVARYRLERCQGVSCSSFSEIATPTTTSYNNTGLTASTTYRYRVRAEDGVGNLSGYSNTFSATTQGGTVCTPAQTRCVAGNIEAVQTCNGSGTGWTQSTCPTWSLCSNSACRIICDITATPIYPTMCMVPNADGVNNGEWFTWYDPLVAFPTYVTGRSYTDTGGYASIYSSGLTWPYAWNISNQDNVYMQFKLNQFGSPYPVRYPRLVYKAKRSGILNYSSYYLVGIFNGATLVASCNSYPSGASLSWQQTNCWVGPGTISLLNASGGWNGMWLSITGNPITGDPPDLIDVNYLRLQMEY